MTVEAAIALASIVFVVVLCLGAALAASIQIRCIDAAREAARLAARGDSANAVTVAERIAPDGAQVSIRVDGEHIVATVTAAAGLLPIDIETQAVAAVEPEPE
ncbi:TadE family type IV pilus minor pilin [Antrihabitans sp. YC2-6]|uniref:TadE family type IV pilus minor pilin n=1 Tax=Antrihabitans sp. YC2-6 TaxID=2799498 RepID=UPI0027DCBC6C|nr:TadE family type IV pilus minor pilin [Antrihabitans sp. YC2-6]